ncbi:O-antigen ligase family protein [Oceanisphaera sp. W20_SRM_FM3]|uniref:O-antigen ligase family protein n=1 Tax=Oceanisphaera sp. W20_SRM_FM3 TaxID=3240267 RepID=UPI003F9934DC
MSQTMACSNLRYKMGIYIEQLFLLSPFIWLMVGVFSVPGGKSALSRLIPLVAVYCLIRFKGEWRTNLNNQAFKAFSIANLIIFVLLTLNHLLGGEDFSFARTLLIVQLYLTLLPWHKITLHQLSLVMALAGIVIGVESIYEVMVLNLGRAGFLALNPIPYATFAAILLISYVYFLFTMNAKKWINGLYSLGAIGAIGAIIFSGTRGVWLAVLLTFFLLAWPLARKMGAKKIFTTTLACCLFIGAGAFVAGEKLTTRYQQTSTEFANMASGNMDTSIGIRLQLWQRGWSYIKQSPLLGTGTPGYLQKIEQDKIAGLISRTAAPLADAHFHNQYIDTLVRTGSLGLFILLAWMLLPTWLLHKQQHYNLRNWTLGCAIIVLISGLTDVPFHHTHIIYLYSMVMGLILLKAESDKLEAES